MLKKQNRLLRLNNLKEALTFPTPFFNLKILKGEKGSKKFGFIVSKKVSKSAVLRNRTKRVVRSIIEEDLDRIEANNNFLLIFKKSLDWNQRSQVKEALESTLKKAKILQ